MNKQIEVQDVQYTSSSDSRWQSPPARGVTTPGSGPGRWCWHSPPRSTSSSSPRWSAAPPSRAWPAKRDSEQVAVFPSSISLPGCSCSVPLASEDCDFWPPRWAELYFSSLSLSCWGWVADSCSSFASPPHPDPFRQPSWSNHLHSETMLVEYISMNI